ncbi:MAG TPA: transposase, partial [Nitrososphaera sp.]|nr:transposase [Nitrososphaera sp.]
MDIRQQKGIAIAAKATIKRDGNLYLVPSQSGKGKYKVDADAKHCTCPDFDFRQAKCKHIYAVEHTIERSKTTVTENGKTTVTEMVKVTRKTYPQVWPAYNKAQTQEKRLFQYLLHQLCQGVGSPAQHGAGQRRMALEDMIFAMAFKVYSTVSGRRFMTDLRDAQGKGYLLQTPSYNVIFDYFQSEMLTPYLEMLIEESSLPLQAIEKDFAVDSSGLSTGIHQRWMEAKWGKVRAEFTDISDVTKRDWIKVHLMCGVTTNVVTSVKVTDNHAGDSPQFIPLVDATAENFTMDEVSADKAYLSNDNLKAVVSHAASPYIPFKANSTITKDKKQSALYKQMYHYFSYNQDRFMKQYHKRSNVETTFHMIKAKFGDKLRSKTRTAQINEALCKVLCHNICCLIQSMYELNLRPKFWSV